MSFNIAITKHEICYRFEIDLCCHMWSYLVCWYTWQVRCFKCKELLLLIYKVILCMCNLNSLKCPFLNAISSIRPQRNLIQPQDAIFTFIFLCDLFKRLSRFYKIIIKYERYLLKINRSTTTNCVKCQALNSRMSMNVQSSNLIYSNLKSLLVFLFLL